MRRRPLVWLAVSAAGLPHVFALTMGAYQALLFMAGFLLTFVLHFLAWCMACYSYAAGPEQPTTAMLSEARLHLASRPTAFLYLSSVFGIGVFFAGNFLVPLLLTMLLAALRPEGSVALGIILEYLRYLLVAMAVTPFALAPQLSILRHDFEEGLDSPTAPLRISYELVKERYRRALPLYLLPEVVALTCLLAFSQLAYYARDSLVSRPYLLVLLIAALALVEGARTCLIAALFNRFLDEVEAEERGKKRKKTSGPKEKKKPGKAGKTKGK